MQFRKAVMADLDRFMDIYSEARRAIGKLGIDQWQDGYPERELIARDIDMGVSFAAEVGGEILGVLAMFLTPEPTYAQIYDGAWKADVPYGTIHRIALSDAARNIGLSRAMFDFCESICRENGVTSLRADTHEGNLRMRRAMEKYGFEYCGVVLLENGAPRVAYEKLL